MFFDKKKIKGRLAVRVLSPSGDPKKRETWNLRVFLGFLICILKGKIQDAFSLLKYEMAFNHNIITNEGDALVADLMCTTPVLQKLDNTHAFIDVGSGWTGTDTKLQEAINTPLATVPTVPKGMEATYPKLKGAFGAADDNVVQYRSIFTAGLINDTGIDEAGLINNVDRATAQMLAYAQITPSVNVTSADTLQVDWEIEFLGT